jgi:hypothetical protein
LDNKYELGIGFGCWARSHENGLCNGYVRFIGGVLMRVYNIHKKGTLYKTDEVSWVPVAKGDGSWAEMKAWVESI